MEAKYYYCSKCNKAVKGNKCDTCSKYFKNTYTYTMAEIEEMIQKAAAPESEGSETVAGEEQLVLVCPLCGKRYGISESVCTCGMTLTMDVSSEQVINDSGDQEILYGEVLATPAWKLIVRRFRNQQVRDEKELLVDRNVFSLGRRQLLFSNTFSYDKGEVQESIRNVSRDNALLVVENEALYVRVDDMNPGTKKPVFVNGKKLEVGETIRLHAGNRILMGHDADKNVNGCVEYEVVELETRNTSANLGAQAFADIKSMLENISSQQQETLENTNRIRETTDNLAVNITDFVNLQSDSFVDVKTHMEEWKNYLSKVREEGEELDENEYLTRYFEGVGEYKEIIQYIQEDEYVDLLDAAQIEYAIKAAGIKVNYSGPFVYIGQLVETFLDVTVRKMLETYIGSRTVRRESQVTVAEELEKASAIGEFTYFYAYTDKETGEIGCKGNGKFFFTKVSEAINRKAKNKGDRVTADEVRDAFLKIEAFKNIRNKACHAGKDNTGEKVKINYEKYVEAKELAFKDGFVAQIRRWYELLY